MKKWKLLITCEHGGNDIPKAYSPLFKKFQKLVKTHRGYDLGALELAKNLSKNFSVPLFFSTISRLLVELNRSVDNRELFSQVTKDLPLKEKEKILQNFYHPYRRKVESFVKQKKNVLHISVHTFTPILNGIARKADIGLLYDPNRINENEFCDNWQKLLKKSPYMIRKNYPYKGTSDGLTTYLRSIFSENNYLGIEIEINQKYPMHLTKQWTEIKSLISQSLREVLG